MFNLIRFELLSHWRQRGEWLNGLVFIFAFAMIFSLATQPTNSSPTILHASVIISLGFLFLNQFVIDGHVRQEKWQGCWVNYLTSSIPTWWIVSIKSICLVLCIALPLIAIMPVIGLVLSLNLKNIIKEGVYVLLATPALVSVGMLASVMTLSLVRSSLLFSLIVMPIVVPIILLGQSALMNEQWFSVEFYFIAAISVLFFTLIPHVVAFLIKETL